MSYERYQRTADKLSLAIGCRWLLSLQLQMHNALSHAVCYKNQTETTKYNHIARPSRSSSRLTPHAVRARPRSHQPSDELDTRKVAAARKALVHCAAHAAWSEDRLPNYEAYITRLEAVRDIFAS